MNLKTLFTKTGMTSAVAILWQALSLFGIAIPQQTKESVDMILLSLIGLFLRDSQVKIQDQQSTESAGQ